MRRELTKYLRLPTLGRSEAGAVSSRRPAVVGGILLILMLLTGLGWAVSSPLESSPDEDYHLGSIWCPRPADEYCQTSVVNGESVVRVPVAVSDDSMKCYVLHSEQSARCALGYSDSEMAWSKRFDNGAYPIGYYHFHHLLIGKDVQTSVLVMRAVNVLIAVALLGTVGFCAPQRMRRPFVAAIVASWIPMGIYFIASNNPSSWSLSGLLAYSAATFMAPQQKGRRRITLVICAVIGAVMCLTSRYDAAFFLLVVGFALLFAVPWRRGGWVGLGALGTVALLGVGTFMASSQVSKVSYFLRAFDTSDPAASADKQSFFDKFIIGLETAPKYLGGFWGHTWTPGWYDVPLEIRAPYVLTIMAAGAFVAIALRRGGWRKWTAMAIIVGAMVLLPALFYANGAMEYIELYQARYIFPLLAPTFFLMLAVDQDEGAWFSVPQAVWVTACASLCQTITLHTLLLRFVQGIGEQWEVNLNKDIQWWWSMPVSPMVVWFFTTCFATAALGIVMTMLTHPAVENREATQHS
ncbi:DUF2142 domain-containing protein [Actinomyces sp. oral taxon 169]|uniref:DUF2142 domain-containing protein n=1 Tax=Actinomyces oris TaxID=544580 RepID=A0A1Q8XAC7_9ACTO|nr:MULTISPECIES: DUF2142 domain-containing protein [Actinomyces]OLO77270.1 hypothetical protein BKH15_05885 [Actinomyces oris]QLF54044.1 DUF2142 domain-containing protein [Actinomyces sp. oral taxon 169]